MYRRTCICTIRQQYCTHMGKRTAKKCEGLCKLCGVSRPRLFSLAVTTFAAALQVNTRHKSVIIMQQYACTRITRHRPRNMRRHHARLRQQRELASALQSWRTHARRRRRHHSLIIRTDRPECVRHCPRWRHCRRRRSRRCTPTACPLSRSCARCDVATASRAS